MFDVKKIRKDFPMIQNHPELVYFDSGATSFKPNSVIEAINHFYCFSTANVHRGDYPIAFENSRAYDAVRGKVARFLNASEEEIVYTKGDTDGLNMLALMLKDEYIREGDVILTTESEHASSVLPWFEIAKEKHAEIRYIPLGSEGEVTMEAFASVMDEKVKIVACTQVSNVLGHINPIKEMTAFAHQYNALMIVDGAQSVPHIKVDVKDLDCDFLAFSAHKMLGPSGAGILYGKKELLDSLKPLYYGGDSNARFNKNCELVLKKGVQRFESGTPAIEQIIGLGAAVDYLSEIGMDNIHAYECELKDYLVQELLKLDNVIVYNPHTDTAIVSFSLKGIFSQDVASYLGSQNIAVRSGNHCAKMVKDIIGIDETLRASLYFYNTKEEIDKLVGVLKETTLEKCIDLFI